MKREQRSKPMLGDQKSLRAAIALVERAPPGGGKGGNGNGNGRGGDGGSGGGDRRGLPEFLEFIRKLNNDLARYIDQRIDERDDGMNLLLRHLEAHQRETDDLRRRVEQLEAAAGERKDVDP
jgi:hypothetical protein